MTAPRTLAEAWLFGKIANTPGVAAVVGRRIAQGRWGGDESAPWAVFQLAAEVSFGPVGQPSTSHELRYQAEFVVPGSSVAPVAPAEAALIVALDGVAEELPGGYAVACSRIGGLPRTASYDEGRVYAHIGSEYRIHVLGSG